MIEITMTNLTKMEETITKRVALLGLPGSGKTTLAAELSKEFNLIWIDIDNAVDTLLKLPVECQERIDVIHLPDSASFPIAADTLLQLFKTGKADICTEHGKVKCAICTKNSAEFNSVDFSKLDPRKDILVLDCATELGHSILSHLVKDKPVDYKPERDQWGALRKFTEFFCSQWKALDVNFVATFHCIETTMEDGRTKLVPNFGSAGMSAEIAKAFGHVIYLETKNKKHVAYSSSTASNSFLSKSRTDFKIEDLEVPSLIPLFRGKLKVADEPKTPGQIALERLKAQVKA